MARFTYLESHDEGQQTFLHHEEYLRVRLAVQTGLDRLREPAGQRDPQFVDVALAAEGTRRPEHLAFDDEETGDFLREGGEGDEIERGGEDEV